MSAPQASQKGFTILRPSELLRMNLPSDTAILGESTPSGDVIYWHDRADAFIVGPGGVGKTRLLFQLAASQILGWSFLGFKTFGPPRRWLLLGNENSVKRLKGQVALLMKDLSEKERVLIEEYLRIHAVIRDVDEILCLEDEDTAARWRETAEAIKPDVIAIDPWEAAIIGGECNDSPATRRSVQLLRQIFRPHSPRATILIVHHSREGSEAIRRAVGFDAGAFVKGSKTLRSIARFGINVAPESADDGGRVVLACGKVNDSPRFATRGAVLSPSTGLYTLNPYFDPQAWVADVDGKGPNKKCSIKRVCEAVRNGAITTAEIVDVLESEASESTVKRLLKEAVDLGYLVSAGRGEYREGARRLA